MITMANCIFRLEQGEGRINSVVSKLDDDSARWTKVESTVAEIEDRRKADGKKLEGIRRDMEKLQDQTKKFKEETAKKSEKSIRECSTMNSRAVALEEDMEYVKKRLYRYAKSPQISLLDI